MVPRHPLVQVQSPPSGVGLQVPPCAHATVQAGEGGGGSPQHWQPLLPTFMSPPQTELLHGMERHTSTLHLPPEQEEQAQSLQLSQQPSKGPVHPELHVQHAEAGWVVTRVAMKASKNPRIIFGGRGG